MRKNAQGAIAVVRQAEQNGAGGRDAIPPQPTPQPTALAPVPFGLERLYEDDLVIPRVSVVQPTSREGTPGRLRMNLTGEERETIDLVVLRVQRGRVLWSPTLGEDPVCRSNDGLVPAADEPQSDVCCELHGRHLRPVCPAATWRPKPGNGGRLEPPACRDTYTVIALDLATGAPFMLALHGSGLRAVRVLRTVLLQRRLNVYDAACTLRLRKQTNGKGSYYVPEFTDIRPVDPPGRYRDRYEQFAAYEPEGTFDAERETDGSSRSVAASAAATANTP
ncbi:MAG: hypothetical protein HY825_16105 [Acidobacteria bacterium]|nr:hypothetical protein [Acidobacteriota bacterium]